LRDVDVVWTVKEPGTTEESEPVLDDFENTIPEDIALLLGLNLEELADQVGPLHAAVALNVHRSGKLVEFFDGFMFKLGNV
jgi:hypothetical protein